MRDELDDLSERVADPTRRAELRWQVQRLRARRTFGLVVEPHLPERVLLPAVPIGVGRKVPTTAS